MASPKSSRRSRKRRKADRAPRAVPSQRREQQAERQATATREDRLARRQLGTQGERPDGPFGNLPVSETAIFGGIVTIAVWFLTAAATSVLVVGIVLIALGVIEVTAREHLSGFRSHTTLLAAIPSVAIGIGVTSAIGTHKDRAPVLIAVAGPLFALLAWLLRRRFQTARQARLARPPMPRGHH